MQIGVNIFGSDFLHYGSFGVPGLDRLGPGCGCLLTGACLQAFPGRNVYAYQENRRIGVYWRDLLVRVWHFPVLEMTTARSRPKKPSLCLILDAASTVKLYLVRLLNKHQIQLYAINPSRDFRNILIVNTVAMPLIHVGLLQI